ncbi:MAG: hypothetical protein ABJC66_12200 [Gammaproteobacteria bacterium]
MNPFQPTPEEQRWMAVGSRVKAAAGGAWLTERVGPWKTVTTRMRCILFVLGAVAAALTTSICSLLHMPAYMLCAGMMLIALAEWLVMARHFFNAGVEEALELAGLVLMVIWTADLTGYLHETAYALLAAAALMLAGARFLNPLFTTLAVLALAFAIESAFSLTLAGAFCFAAGIVALTCGAVPLRRPAHEQMLNFLVIAMPLAGYAWGADGPAGNAAGVHGLPVCMLPVYGATALALGVQRRRHPPIVAFLVCVGCLAYELRNLTGLTLQVRLIAWGSAALALAAAIDRYLRTPRRGITSLKLAEDDESAGLLQLVGAASLTPPVAQGAGSGFKGGGGTGGGGGASGTY